MLRLSTIALFAIALLCVSAPPRWTSAQEQGTTYWVGVAKQDVTPDYSIRLNGFAARKAPSDGASQQIWARALAIREAEAKPVVIVTLDSLGIRSTMVDEVAKRVNETIELDRERLIVTFTHTHSAPKVNGASDNIFAEAIPEEDQRPIDRYTEELTQALSEVVVAALQDLQPSTLEWGVGQVGFAMNRRTAGGPTDHALPVLVVRSSDESRTIRAIYTTYACHCVTLSDTKINGDWAGYAVESIERYFPGAIGMVSIGCGSDQNPDSGVTGDKTDVAQQQGMQIGDEVVRLVRGERLGPIGGKIRLQASQLKLAFDPIPSVAEYERMRDAGGAAGYNASTQLAKIDSGQELPTSLPYPMQVVSFGDDLCMVFLAGEVCVDYALRIRRELNGTKLWMHGYSNDFGAYIPSERLLREGGYGAGAEIPYFALPTKLKAGLEQQIVDEVHRLVPDSFDVPEGTDGVPPQTPQASLRMMETHEDLQIQLVACEPQIADPVAIDFGLNGELWVVQMNDYGHGVDEAFHQSGEVRQLKDTDGDGFFETSQVFIGGLRYPTDVKVWRDGILVCDAPDILYLVDADGDGVADQRQVLFTGFATHNGQARVNSLRWGIDNWLYGSCGLFGGQITNARGETFELTQRDFRMHPDIGEMEPVTGRTQQGRVRDDFGHWFGCDNGTLIREYVIEDRYLRRNPFAEPPSTSVYVPTGDNAGRLFPSSELVLFKLSGSGGVATAACGLGIYRDNKLGEGYYGNSFTCEPVNQLVYRQVLSEEAGIVRGRRADSEQDRDFLTSRDQWFRPVQVRTGLDGGLWIVDMYRYVIEHPIWIPDERKQQLNLFAGQNMGRIYRVVPKTGMTFEARDLRQCSNDELVALLDEPNGSLRDLIHQLLVWREAQDVQGQLEHLVGHGSLAAVRVQAMGVLSGLGQLSEATCLLAFEDADPRVRRAAIQFAEPLLRSSERLQQAVLRRAEDSDFEVRLQVAYTLGEIKSSDVARVWQELYENSDNQYLRYALLSSLNDGNVAAVTERLLAGETTRKLISERYVQVATELAHEDSVVVLVRGVLQADDESFAWRASRLVAILNVLDRRDLTPLQFKDDMKKPAQKLVDHARKTLANTSELDDDSKAALLLLGRRWGANSSDLLGPDEFENHSCIAELISPLKPVGVQQAAVEGLMRRGEAQGAEFLLTFLPQASPAMRQAIVKAFLQQSRWAPRLVSALENETFRIGDFDAAQRQQLQSQLDDSHQSRLVQLFDARANTNRSEVLEKYQAVVTQRGDVQTGRQVFRKSCATCHRLEDFGTAVGPDLAALTTLTSQSLLTAILDPNREVDGRYQSYVVITTEGLSYSGVLTEETSTSVNIVDQQGQSHSLLRQRIEALQSTGKSAMPEGLEEDLSEAEMANLLAYLQEAGPTPKSFAGNRPRAIEPDQKGRLSLVADAASIYGDEIAFESESPFKNIGYWHRGSDRVAWNVIVTRPGDYDVWLDYACADATAGKQLVLDGGEEPLVFQVQGTGGWDRYQRVRLGSLHLEPGQTRLVAHGNDAFQGSALLDLRAVILEPK